MCVCVWCVWNEWRIRQFTHVSTRATPTDTSSLRTIAHVFCTSLFCFSVRPSFSSNLLSFRKKSNRLRNNAIVRLAVREQSLIYGKQLHRWSDDYSVNDLQWETRLLVAWATKDVYPRMRSTLNVTIIPQCPFARLGAVDRNLTACILTKLRVKR